MYGIYNKPGKLGSPNRKYFTETPYITRITNLLQEIEVVNHKSNYDDGNLTVDEIVVVNKLERRKRKNQHIDKNKLIKKEHKMRRLSTTTMDNPNQTNNGINNKNSNNNSSNNSHNDVPQLLLTRPVNPSPLPSFNMPKETSGSNESLNKLHLNINNCNPNNNNNNNNVLSGSSSNGNFLNTPMTNRRKFSFPVALHSAFLLNETNTSSARRRLSNVSDVVTRKLSSTIGWKNAAIPSQEIIAQGKCLCGQYIRYRLKRAGIFNRKLGLQRMRSMLGTQAVHTIRDIFYAINYMGEELEKMHPRVYTNVAKQLCRDTGGELPSEESAPVLLTAMARYLFKGDISWSKIISLFAVTGGLAVDCVRQGHPDYLPKLVEAVGDIVEDDLVQWINDNGGWIGLNSHVKSIIKHEFKLFEYSIILCSCTFGIILLILLFKLISYYLSPFLFKS